MKLPNGFRLNNPGRSPLSEVSAAGNKFELFSRADDLLKFPEAVGEGRAVETKLGSKSDSLDNM